MESGNTFSLQRLMLLFKQSFTINKKQLAITIISIAAIFFVILVLSQSAAQFVKWRPSNGLILFEIFFFAFGIVY